MTQRKPPNVSFPDWVERQIRDAQAKGDFENLPGAGKPLPDRNRPRHDLTWVADYLQRENVDVAALLPPALALAKEVEVLPERLLKERSEASVREIVADLNQRIRAAHRAPQDGPPVRVYPVAVEELVEQWSAAKAALDAARSRPVAASPPPPARRRRFGRRRFGRRRT
jgi:DnaJ-like protein